MISNKLFRTAIFGVLILVLALANSGCYYRYGYYGSRYGYSHRVYVPSPPPRVYYYHKPNRNYSHYNRGGRTSRYNDHQRKYNNHHNYGNRGGGRYRSSGGRYR
ncbi:MAG: hypothetical protein U0V04_14300 [Spirosomataceae bacterium]